MRAMSPGTARFPARGEVDPAQHLALKALHELAVRLVGAPVLQASEAPFASTRTPRGCMSKRLGTGLEPSITSI